MKVSVEPYDATWPQQFSQIKVELEKILHDVPYLSIEHVGSTSVPGLCAKPILDIDIVVTRAQLSPVAAALETMGGYESMGEMGLPDRWAFRKQSALPSRNLYVCIAGSQALRNHLAVRDICRRYPQVREAYGQKKLELSQREWGSVDEYCEAKNEILEWVLEKAGMAASDREQVRKLNTADHAAR